MLTMPTTITQAERDLYTDVWGGVDQYREVSPGRQYLPLFLQMVGDQRGTVLDAGCGAGEGARALAEAGFTPFLCDLTDEGLTPEARAFPFREACLWHPLRPQLRQGRFDWAYCCDVLEHVPMQFTLLAVEQLLRVVDRAVFLSIALVPDSLGVLVGKRLHQTVQPFTWWRDSLREIGVVEEARDLIQAGIFLVRPR